MYGACTEVQSGDIQDVQSTTHLQSFTEISSEGLQSNIAKLSNKKKDHPHSSDYKIFFHAMTGIGGGDEGVNLFGPCENVARRPTRFREGKGAGVGLDREVMGGGDTGGESCESGGDGYESVGERTCRRAASRAGSTGFCGGGGSGIVEMCKFGL